MRHHALASYVAKIVKGRVRVAQCGFLANMLIMGFWHGITT